MAASIRPLPTGRPGRPSDLTADDVRWLAWHEACSHALAGREVRDLGDAYLLHDPTDREPFWNRIAGLDWPSDPVGFDRRLTEFLALFAGLDRIPHVWPSPGFDRPGDLVARLVANGFEDHGAGLLMALDPARFTEVETARTSDAAASPSAAGERITVERFHRLVGQAAADAAQSLAGVLETAFAVEPARRIAIELEAVQGLTTDAYHALLVRVDGHPAAVARRTTFAGASYLSSIGTAPAFRGRGLGRLATKLVVSDALAAGSSWTYLGVFEENGVARSLYDALGFVPVGSPSPDLLLRP